jgi:hypothetical protein
MHSLGSRDKVIRLSLKAQKDGRRGVRRKRESRERKRDGTIGAGGGTKNK